jgi:hypothetical protein
VEEDRKSAGTGTQPAHAWRFLQVRRVAPLSLRIHTLHTLHAPAASFVPEKTLCSNCRARPGPDILLLGSDDLLMASQESERSWTHRDGSEDSLIVLIRLLTFIYRRFMLGDAARWVALECALSCTKLRDRVHSHDIGSIYKYPRSTRRVPEPCCDVHQENSSADPRKFSSARQLSFETSRTSHSIHHALAPSTQPTDHRSPATPNSPTITSAPTRARRAPTSAARSRRARTRRGPRPRRRGACPSCPRGPGTARGEASHTGARARARSP